MFATSEAVVPPATTTLLYLDSPREYQTSSKPSPRSFKKHKVLPRPRANNVLSGGSPASRVANGYRSAPNPKKEPATPPRSTHSLSDTGVIGPDPPPTPPANSRTSSGDRPTLASSSSISRSSAPVETTAQSAIATGIVTPVPGTPILHKSPPTPDVTPPQLGRRSKGPRPAINDRIPSKGTTDSRTESFRTARESPGESDEDKVVLRPFLAALGAFDSGTARQVDSEPGKQEDARSGSGLNLEDTLTPRARQEFYVFDGEWASNSEVEQEWDDNLDRNVLVRKRPDYSRNDRPAEMMEDTTATPTSATSATNALRLRPTHLHEHKNAAPSPQPPSMELASKGRPRWPASNSELSMNADLRRSSGMSTKSTVSTVVEAILVDVPPQRQKTLRHVRKQTTLRDSGSEMSPSSSTSNSVRQFGRTQRPVVPGSPAAPRTNSVASVGTVNSMASRKARLQVWKSGGIPVVVIPDRKESLKPTRPPSLRSRDSHRARRSNSLGSAPRPNHYPAKDLSPSLDRPPRKSRPMSITYGTFPNDQLTMDYPPIVPRRLSSLSAPTSRNTSRAGSLTAESLKAHNTLVLQEKVQPQQVAVEPVILAENTISQPDQKQPYPDLPVESHKTEMSNQRSLVDHNGDPFFGKRLTAYNTPFSQASVETNGTHSAADIAEAMAVNIYSHQNKSVLMVDHVSRPVGNANDGHLEDSSRTDPPALTNWISDSSDMITSDVGDGSVTPQLRFSVPDANSPLRNPRVPPEPPSINFIPATPSARTPVSENDKTMGNFFEETQNRPSLVRRAFSLRKNTGNPTSRKSGLLSRTFSLSKTTRKNTGDQFDLQRNEPPILHRRLTTDDSPSDRSKLHPFWRPAYDRDADAHDLVYKGPDTGLQHDHYSPVTSRSAKRRSIGERMKRTFAILPIEDDNHYTAADHRSPERRTIKRTSSGNLRVVPHHGDLNSVRRGWLPREGGERPSTAPENPNRRLWAPEKRVDDRGRRVFPGWQEKLEQYKPQNIQRRLCEHRRQKRTEALRQKISGPREVRDGVGDVIKRSSYNGPSYQSGLKTTASGGLQS
ncbi:hypothetical protein GGR50DRAFT_3491 [Xylaria sp. CBS 124048]|nr:hypothetical protein GGR50DRAFT_3491 [Xylaria sp. CBS 124048]